MYTVTERLKKNSNDIGHNRFQTQTWKQFESVLHGRKLYLFGAGNACYEFLEEYGNKVSVEGIIENNLDKVGQKINKIPIISLDSIKNEQKESCVILITSTLYDDDICSQLEREGFSQIFSVYGIVSKIQKRITYKLNDFFFSPMTGFFCNRNIFYNYVVFHFMAFLRSIHFWPAYKPYKQLKKYKGIHKGERCFVIASGPSLTIEDIELINSHDEVTFSMNNVIKIFDKTAWRPDYYVLEDPKFIHFFDWNSELMNVDEICREAAFFPSIFKKTGVGKHKKTNFYPISYLGHLMKADDKRMKFNKDFIHGIYCAYTVTNVCIQLACYMGFSEVYLIGTDCNYSGVKKHFTNEIDDHIYKEDHARIIHDNLLRGYAYTAEKVSKYGTKVFNASRGGMLDVIPRIDLDTLF